MYKKPDYSYKSYILNNYQNLLLAHRQAKLFDNAVNQFELYGVITWSLLNGSQETMTDLYRYCKATNLETEFHECEKINHAFFSRKCRLKDKITYFVNHYSCSFLTLTFTNDVLNNTSAETRRRYVARHLKSFGVPYVANIDFGEKNGREHYHAVICAPLDSCSWSYGYSSSEKIHTDDLSKERLSTYITKLTNHAIKETTKRSSLLYSRVVY